MPIQIIERDITKDELARMNVGFIEMPLNMALNPICKAAMAVPS